MKLFLSKLIPLFVYPLGFALVLVVLATALLNVSRRVARDFLVVAVLVLWGASTQMVSEQLRSLLERQFPPVAVDATPTADAIVVLGGAVGGVDPPRISPDLQDTSDRVLHAARLYRAGKAPIVLLSGGAIPWLGSDTPEAESMRALLEEWGVPAAAIVVEADSRNTYENAMLTRQLLVAHRLRRVLLVTSALHMRRALATFTSAGIDAVPATTDYTVTDKPYRTLLDFLPDADALSGTTKALKEYVGYVYYRWQGWIAT